MWHAQGWLAGSTAECEDELSSRAYKDKQLASIQAQCDLAIHNQHALHAVSILQSALVILANNNLDTGLRSLQYCIKDDPKVEGDEFSFLFFERLVTVHSGLQRMLEMFNFIDAQSEPGQIHSASVRVKDQLVEAVARARQGAALDAGDYSEADRLQEWAKSQAKHEGDITSQDGDYRLEKNRFPW